MWSLSKIKSEIYVLKNNKIKDILFYYQANSIIKLLIIKLILKLIVVLLLLA